MFTVIMNATASIPETLTEERGKICRLCGKSSKDYFPIFEENNLYILEKISRCLPIIVLSTDKLPHLICKRCLHYLNISYKLIITSLEVDVLLQKQFYQLEKNSKDNQSDMKEPKKAITQKLKCNRSMSLKELKRKAIAGPAECEFCDIVFPDIDMFDNHMEVIHLLDWQCNLCDNTFHTSGELITHKTLKHGGNITICKACVCTKKYDINMEEEVQTPSVHHAPKLQADNNQTLVMMESLSVKLKAEEKEEISLTMEADAKPRKSEKLALSTRTISESNVQKQKCGKGEKDSPLFCAVCKICFGDEHHFGAHRKIHELKQIPCVSCHIECSSIYDLFLHKRAVHNLYKKVQLKYVCDKCDKFFTNSWQWESHKGNTCPKKMSDNCCKYCKNIFTTSHKLMRHLRKHKSEMFNDPTVTVYKCIACPKVFVDKEFYQKHRNVHDPECWDKFRCTSCNRSFRDNVRLREHQLSIHEGIKPHQCDVCGRTFHRFYNMKVHRATHFNHKCNYCDKSMKRVKDLMKHVKDDHGIEPDIRRRSHRTTYISSTYVCRYCGKKLASYQSLINHEHIHTGEKPYSCKICHKTFRSYTSRWAHTQRHEKGNFVCEHCGKCFSYKQNLTVHVQTHLPMEDRKHQCAVCGKRFLRKCHLNIHMRIHDGIRPYTCDICFFSFTQKGDMKRHRIRHSKGDIRVRRPRNKDTMNKAEGSKT